MLVDLHNHTNVSSPCSLLSPEELLVALYALRDDADGEVRKAAASTLKGYSDDVLAGLLRDPQQAPEVLDFFASVAVVNANGAYFRPGSNFVRYSS